jgi:DNA adenine methylase
MGQALTAATASCRGRFSCLACPPEGVLMQPTLPFVHPQGEGALSRAIVPPFKAQLLKWIGNKQRYAHEIASFFPARFGTYYEPFLGSGAVLGSLAPKSAVASDAFKPLMEIWETLKCQPDQLQAWYAERWGRMTTAAKEVVYEQVKASFNASPNGADLLFLCRSCYGGVVRFRKADGYMSTPCGAHQPVSPASFARRADEWRRRCRHTEFVHADYAAVMAAAGQGDLVYCDPPYVDTQTILYGAQDFSLAKLFDVIARCKAKGAYVALSIDGTKRSGDKICNVPIPAGLFETEASVNCGRSMLRRFQMAGQTLEGEVVSDRLLLTYSISEL